VKRELNREEMIALIASDYGIGPEITNKLTTEILRNTCNNSQPFNYLKSLLEVSDNREIYLPEHR